LTSELPCLRVLRKHNFWKGDIFVAHSPGIGSSKVKKAKRGIRTKI